LRGTPSEKKGSLEGQGGGGETERKGGENRKKIDIGGWECVPTAKEREGKAFAVPERGKMELVAEKTQIA